MDPADTQRALTSQGSLLGQHKQLIRVLLDNLAAMVQSVSDLAQQLSRLAGSVPSSTPAAGSATSAANSSMVMKDSCLRPAFRC